MQVIDPLHIGQNVKEVLGCDLYVVPVSDPMEQMDAIRKKHGEGRHKALAAMIAETLKP